jgi:hypothetical protein
MTLVICYEYENCLRFDAVGGSKGAPPGERLPAKRRQTEKVKNQLTKGTISMAAGAAPAPEKKTEAQDETATTSQPQPTGLRQRIERKLTEIFQGHDEYLGWRQ